MSRNIPNISSFDAGQHPCQKLEPNTPGMLRDWFPLALISIRIIAVEGRGREVSWSFLSSLIEGRGVKFPLLQGPQALEQLVGRPQSPSERCCCVSIRFSPSIRKSMWCWRKHSKSIEAKQLGNHAGTCRHSQDRLFCVARWCWYFEQDCVNGFALPFLRPILQPGCLVPWRSPQATDSLTPRHAQSFCLQAAWRGLCGRCPQGSPRLRLLRLAPKARTPFCLRDMLHDASRPSRPLPGPTARPGLGAPAVGALGPALPKLGKREASVQWPDSEVLPKMPGMQPMVWSSLLQARSASVK